MRATEIYSRQDSWRREEDRAKYVANNPTVRELIVKELGATLAPMIRELVEQTVKADPEIERQIENAKRATIIQFPEMVKAAVISWFAQGMEGMAKQLQEVMSAQAKTAYRMGDIAAKLGMPPQEQQS